MRSTEVGSAGRTIPTLTKRQVRPALLHPSERTKQAAVASCEGEGVGNDAESSSVDLKKKVARATTRFEFRLRPKHEDGTPHVENLALLAALDECSRMVATGRNVAMRALERTDAEALDAFLSNSGGVMPRGKELDWPSYGSNRADSPVYSYRAIRSVCPRLNTSVAAWLGKDVSSKWGANRWEVLIAQTKARPHCKPTHPIPIPSAVVRIRKTDTGAALTFRLYSTDAEGETSITVPLVARDARQREELDALVSGEWKLGQVVLSRHHEKRGRWFARLSYTKLVEAKTGAIRVAARRGMRSLLVAACTDGDVREIDGGADIVEFKRRMDARRRSFGHRERGPAAVGHGVRRALNPLIALTDKEARYSKDRCKRAASLLVKYALSRGASEVYFEDFSTPKREGDYWLLARWPWFMLAESCKTALEAVGIKVATVSVVGNRKNCPVCKHVHEERPENSFGTWTCAACGMKRSAEQVQVLNMLDDNEATTRAETARANAMSTLRGVLANENLSGSANGRFLHV
jgi:ribosomal protein L37AE/L43A